MKKVIVFLLLLIAVAQSIPSSAQRTRKRPPKGDNVQTQTDAVAKKKSEREAKMDEYKMRREQLMKIQDKSTQKRMKKNAKHSQRQFLGKDTPWYKRIFRRKKF